ncbi:MAG TPA: SHOCT domain-containing protein [Ktedonobacterales bacterium]
MDITTLNMYGWGGDWFGYGGYGWPWPGIIWVIGFLLFWGALLALLIWAVRSSTGSHRPHDTPKDVLRRRLAAGEISEEEYERLRKILED